MHSVIKVAICPKLLISTVTNHCAHYSLIPILCGFGLIKQHLNSMAINSTWVRKLHVTLSLLHTTNIQMFQLLTIVYPDVAVVSVYFTDVFRATYTCKYAPNPKALGFVLTVIRNSEKNVTKYKRLV